MWVRILEYILLNPICNQTGYTLICSNISVLDGIIVGAVGGAIAGLVVWVITVLREKYTAWRDKKQIYNWLYKVTKQENVPDWNNISGNDSKTFLMFLRKDLDIHWAKNAEIPKRDDDQTIHREF